MKKLALVFHSAHGHTGFIAQHVAEGARSVADTRVAVLDATAVAQSPQDLLAYDGFIFGSPTYLGGVSAQFKGFMDATGRLWREQRLKGRIAAGFTVSSLPAGDKQTTLISLFTFSMQHGMVWVGNPIIPEQHSGVPCEHAANRLGSWTGLMAQAGHAAPAESFAPGDVKTAHMFGRHVATSLHCMACEPAPEVA